jgi:hypothetical protein
MASLKQNFSEFYVKHEKTVVNVIKSKIKSNFYIKII